jgi:hypothetical protein
MYKLVIDVFEILARFEGVRNTPIDHLVYNIMLPPQHFYNKLRDQRDF